MGMKTQFERMMGGLNDVEAFLAGGQEGFRVHVAQDVGVKGVPRARATGQSGAKSGKRPMCPNVSLAGMTEHD